MHSTIPFRTIAAIALAGCAAGGCAPEVTLSPARTTLPAAFEAVAGLPGDPSPAVPAALARWWPAFEDPQLGVLVEGALVQSTTVRLAYARLSTARANRSIARAATLPTGNISATATEQGTRRLSGSGVNATSSETYQATLYPSWEIDLFGRLDALRDRADTDYAASRYDFYAARLALAADVATTLFTARGTAIDLATARERLEISQGLARTSRISFERGLGSGQDNARLASDLATARAETIRLDAELRVLKRSLLILVGNPDASTDTIVIEPALAAPPGLLRSTPGELLARRPDVLSAELNLRSAALDVQASRLALFPRFDIQPGLGLSAGGGAGVTGLWSLATGLSVPVLDRTRLMAQLRLSQAQGEQAVVVYEQAVQTAFEEAENALTRLEAVNHRIQELEEAELQARRAFEIARRGYAAGLTDLTTLLQSEQTWLQARSARDQGRLTRLTGTVSAIRAMGGGWENEAIVDQREPRSGGAPR